MIDPVVAIIVLTWNGEQDTLECLASLGQVDYSNVRVIVVDNGSSDNTVARVRAEYPETTVIENGSNLGFAEGNNTGIRHALEGGAEYVLLLNNDTEVHPRFVRHLVDAGEADSLAGVLGPKIRLFGERDRVWYGGGWVQRWAGASGHRGLGELDQAGPTEPVETGYVTGCALMVKAELLRKIGMLEPAFFIYWEDVDFCLRARRAGFRSVYVPAAVVWHKISRAYGGDTGHGLFYGGRAHGPESPVSLYLGTRNNLLFIERSLGWPARLPVLVFALGRKVAKMLALLLPRRDISRRKGTAIRLGIRDYFRRRFGAPPWSELKRQP